MLEITDLDNAKKKKFYEIHFFLMASHHGEMVNKLDPLLLNSEFDPHWMPHICGLVLNLNYTHFLMDAFCSLMVCKLNWLTTISGVESHWVVHACGLQPQQC